MAGTMDLNDLRLFVEVARLASFVGAGRRTGTPTSSVSRAVARLEAALGVRLLRRTSRRVAPTDEGAALLERAAPLLEGLDSALEGAAGAGEQPSGRLRVTAPLFTGAELVGRALASFAAAHPQVTVDLQLSNAVSDLVEEGFDLAFRTGPVKASGLVARRLWRLPYALAASPGFVRAALGGRLRLTRARLESLPAVVTRPDATWRFVGRGGRRVAVRPSVRFSAGDPRVAAEAAALGLGVACLPVGLLERHARALVQLRADCGEPEGRELFAVFPSRRQLPRRVRLALEWVARAAES